MAFLKDFNCLIGGCLPYKEKSYYNAPLNRSFSITSFRGKLCIKNFFVISEFL